MTEEEMAAAVKKAQDDAQAEIKKAQDDLVKAQTERDEAVEKAKAFAGKKAPPFGDDKSDDDKDDSDVSKADLPPAVQARLEKAEAETVALRKQADEATALAKSERDLRVEREFVAKAEREFTGLAQDPAEFGPLLKRASENLSKEDYERFESMFKAAGNQIATGDLFKAFGASGEAPRGTDALSEVARKAEELRKSDSSLSATDAQAQVFAANPDLQAAYLASVR